MDDIFSWDIRCKLQLIISEFRQVLKLKDTKFGGVTVTATDLEEAVEKVDPSEC